MKVEMYGFRALAIGAGLGLGMAWGQVDSLTASQPKWEVLDGIVAVVGDEIVLESDVEAAVFARLAERAQQGKSGALEADERCALLEEALFTKLLVHQARIDSVEVTESEVLA
jgi:peptidyl-prolyl cis-trans isomerase SurA